MGVTAVGRGCVKGLPNRLYACRQERPLVFIEGRMKARNSKARHCMRKDD